MLSFRTRAALVFAATALSAQASSTFPGEAWDANYLQAALEKPVFIDPSIFQLIAPGDPINEIPFLKKAAELRSSASMALSHDEIAEPMHHVFEVSTPNPQIKPTSLTLLFLARKDANVVITRLQVLFSRPRPNMVEPSISEAYLSPGYPSYPSRTATESYLAAIILSRLDPPNTKAYLQRAEEIMRRTEVAGLQFPTDGAAGRSLALRIAEALFQQPSFNRIFDAAQTEWPAQAVSVDANTSHSSSNSTPLTNLIDRIFK